MEHSLFKKKCVMKRFVSAMTECRVKTHDVKVNKALIRFFILYSRVFVGA